MTYETAFTPLASLAGGAMIGLAAVLLMLLMGRILGATGILAGVIGFGDRAGWPLRAALLAQARCEHARALRAHFARNTSDLQKSRHLQKSRDTERHNGGTKQKN